MKTRGIILVGILAAGLALAQQPISELQGTPTGGGASAAPVAVMNFPSVPAGNLLTASVTRTEEMYLVLEPEDGCSDYEGHVAWRVPFPDGGPWQTVTWSTNFDAAVDLRFAASEWDDPAQAPVGSTCNCQCGVLIPVTVPTGNGDYYYNVARAMGDQLLISTWNGELTRRVYVRFDR